MTVLDEDLLSAWSFDLPEERIARHPLPQRTASRLLHLAADGSLHHRSFVDVVSLLNEGDCLVVNDTSVLPARLFGSKESGGKIELLLIRPDRDAWIVLLNASKKPKERSRCFFSSSSGDFSCTVLGPVDGEPGAWRVRFSGDPVAFAREHGAMPLPPYLQRAAEEDDDARYQTVFRDPDKLGSSAAPTAGLHFDDEILAKLAAKGVKIAKVTLHVGPGTFLPVHSARLSEHPMHPEPWWVPSSTAALLKETRANHKRIVAVGTTAARVLESSKGAAGEGLTRLFIRPGHVVTTFDALITNFHLPQSTLLVLVGTLVGRARLLSAYAEAVAAGYRFYSYGDACFVEVAR